MAVVPNSTNPTVGMVETSSGSSIVSGELLPQGRVVIVRHVFVLDSGVVQMVIVGLTVVAVGLVRRTVQVGYVSCLGGEPTVKKLGSVRTTMVSVDVSIIRTLLVRKPMVELLVSIDRLSMLLLVNLIPLA